MNIKVLVCKPDGSQIIETRKVPADYFPGELEPEPQPDTNAFVLGLMEGYYGVKGEAEDEQ